MDTKNTRIERSPYQVTVTLKDQEIEIILPTTYSDADVQRLAQYVQAAVNSLQLHNGSTQR